MLRDLLESPRRGVSNKKPQRTILLINYVDPNHAENPLCSSIKVSLVRRCSRNRCNFDLTQTATKYTYSLANNPPQLS